MDTPNDPLRDAARRMLERGIAPEKVKAFVQRARAREQANAKDAREAGEMSGLGKAATFVERGVNSASFGLGGLAGDAIAAGLDSDKSFKDVRAERADRNSQLGPLGYLADIAGAAMPGVAAFKTLSAIPRVAKMGAVKVAAAEAAGQGGVTGAAEGLDDLSLEGLAKSAKTGLATAAGGAVLGGTVGGIAGQVASRLKGRNLAKELVAKGVNVEEAKLLARELPMMTMEKANAAIGRVDEMVKQGRGDLVMAADVMQDEGRNALRASMNISGDAETVAKQRLRERDSGIVARGRKDLGDAAGFTPEQMDAHEDAIIGTRKAKADKSYTQARAEGDAFDSAPIADADLDVVNEAASDPRVLSEFKLLQSRNTAKYADADPMAFDVQMTLYQRLNKRLRALDKSPSADPAEVDALVAAREKLGSALELRSPTFRPANADYADLSKGLEAYRTGQQAASQSFPSNARRVAKRADPTQGTELNKGFVDRMSEQLGRGPNEALGPAARADNSIRNATVGTENAGEKIKDRLGDAAYQKLLGNAKAEGQMAATSNAGLGNSSTAKQQSGLAGLLNVAGEAGASISANPIWFGTQFARRVATDKMGSMRKKVASEAAKKISDALTRGGEKEAKSVLEDLIAEMNRRQMADAAGKSAARRTRNAVARAAAPND